jgi:uncharacterized lipoprotein YmbA
VSVASGASSQSGSKETIGIWSINIPDHLKRSQIVTRADDNRIEMARFDRWAEPLDEGFARVLRENLSLTLPSHRVYVFPWSASITVDSVVEVEVLRFDYRSSADVTLQAEWAILDRDGNTVLTRETSDIHRSPELDDYDAIVAAMSAALADLSREIAGAIAP